VAEREVRSRLQKLWGPPMADYRSSRMHEDLGPRATSALGAAYDAALQSPELRSDEHALLRYSLACHLVKAAFAGEQDAGLLRERARAYVTEWFKPPRLVA
jgi:hypothetical protein